MQEIINQHDTNAVGLKLENYGNDFRQAESNSILQISVGFNGTAEIYITLK